MSKRNTIREARQRRQRRVRARVVGSVARPRLSVFRSAQHCYAQVINDATGVTIAAASDHAMQPAAGEGRKIALARAVGRSVAERAIAKGVTTVVFDRGSYAYHGRVKAVAEGAREAGLQF